MFAVLPIVILAADISPGDIRWQNILMDLFFADITPQHLRGLSESSFTDPGHNDYCTGFWKGISCSGATVTEIAYAERAVGAFRFHELPPTIKRLSISDCQQTARLHTRRLPRELVILSLSKNQIHGSIDLTTLPPPLKKAFLWNNLLTDPISLCHLPVHLILLELQGNRISQKVVWYDNMPETIRTIQLQYTDQTKIGKVLAVNPKKAVSSHVFFGMRDGSVQ